MNRTMRMTLYVLSALGLFFAGSSTVSSGRDRQETINAVNGAITDVERAIRAWDGEPQTSGDTSPPIAEDSVLVPGEALGNESGDAGAATTDSTATDDDTAPDTPATIEDTDVKELMERIDAVLEELKELVEREAGAAGESDSDEDEEIDEEGEGGDTSSAPDTSDETAPSPGDASSAAPGDDGQPDDKSANQVTVIEVKVSENVPRRLGLEIRLKGEEESLIPTAKSTQMDTVPGRPELTAEVLAAKMNWAAPELLEATVSGNRVTLKFRDDREYDVVQIPPLGNTNRFHVDPAPGPSQPPAPEAEAESATEASPDAPRDDPRKSKL